MRKSNLFTANYFRWIGVNGNYEIRYEKRDLIQSHNFGVHYYYTDKTPIKRDSFPDDLLPEGGTDFQLEEHHNGICHSLPYLVFGNLPECMKPHKYFIIVDDTSISCTLCKCSFAMTPSFHSDCKAIEKHLSTKSYRSVQFHQIFRSEVFKCLSTEIQQTIQDNIEHLELDGEDLKCRFCSQTFTCDLSSYEDTNTHFLHLSIHFKSEAHKKALNLWHDINDYHQSFIGLDGDVVSCKLCKQQLTPTGCLSPAKIIQSHLFEDFHRNKYQITSQSVINRLKIVFETNKFHLSRRPRLFFCHLCKVSFPAGEAKTIALHNLAIHCETETHTRNLKFHFGTTDSSNVIPFSNPSEGEDTYQETSSLDINDQDQYILSKVFEYLPDHLKIQRKFIVRQGGDFYCKLCDCVLKSGSILFFACKILEKHLSEDLHQKQRGELMHNEFDEKVLSKPIDDKYFYFLKIITGATAIDELEENPVGESGRSRIRKLLVENIKYVYRGKEGQLVCKICLVVISLPEANKVEKLRHLATHLDGKEHKKKIKFLHIVY